MDRDLRAGATTVGDAGRDLADEPRREHPRHRAGPARSDRRRPRRSRATSAGPSRALVDRRQPGARLGCGRRRHSRPAPPADRHARHVRDRHRPGLPSLPTPAGTTPSRSSTRARATCVSSTPCPAPGFDVIVNGDHLAVVGRCGRRAPGALPSGTSPTWSATRRRGRDEVSGERRLISSDTGDGWDASRILLPEVRDQPRGRAWRRRAAS